MIQLPTETKTWIAVGGTDMRRGFDRLSAQVRRFFSNSRSRDTCLCFVAAGAIRSSYCGGMEMACDLSDRLPTVYDPQPHPSAHARLIKLLYGVGISSGRYARGSTLADILLLVQDGYGFTMIRERTSLIRTWSLVPMAEIDWTVDNAFIYHLDRFPMTVLILGETETSWQTLSQTRGCGNLHPGEECWNSR